MPARSRTSSTSCRTRWRAFRGLGSGYKRAEAFIMQTGSPFDLFAMTGLTNR